MSISEEKMKIVINNYFKSECDVNTSIREAFEKGFRIGVKKGANTNKPQGEWNRLNTDTFHCKLCGRTFIMLQGQDSMNYCPNCGARMKGADDE